MFRWITTLWSVLALALAMSLCYEASASIQHGPVAKYNEGDLAAAEQGAASSGHGSTSAEASKNSPDRSEASETILLLWNASNKLPSSGNSSSPASPTLGSGTGALLVAKEFQLPDANARVERLVCDDSLLSSADFVSRLLRPPRFC